MDRNTKTRIGLCCFARGSVQLGQINTLVLISYTESPHAMDMSIVLEDEKPVSVNEVPDYHEDIHTYLREMEVRLFIKND